MQVLTTPEMAGLIDAAQTLTETLTAAFRSERAAGSPITAYLGSANLAAAEALLSLANMVGALTPEALSAPNAHKERAILDTLTDAGMDVEL